MLVWSPNDINKVWHATPPTSGLVVASDHSEQRRKLVILLRINKDYSRLVKDDLLWHISRVAIGCRVTTTSIKVYRHCAPSTARNHRVGRRTCEERQVLTQETMRHRREGQIVLQSSVEFTDLERLLAPSTKSSI